MRVWSERPQRLRSRVLVHFDGTGWSRDAARFRELVPAEGEVALDDAARAFIGKLPGVDFVPLPEKLHRQRLIQTRVVRVDGAGLATPGGSYLVRAPIDKLQVDPAAVVLLPSHARVRVYGVLHDVNHQRVQEAAPNTATRQASLELPKHSILASAISPRVGRKALLATRTLSSGSSPISAKTTAIR